MKRKRLMGRRRFSGILLVVVLIVVLGFLVVVGQGRGTELKDLVVGRERWNEIIAGREKTEEGLVSRVNFSGEEIFTAEKGKKWYYSMVERAEGAKNPRISYRGEGVELAVSEEITDEAIEKGEAIEVVAYTEGKYEIYKLYVTTLPVMRIEHLGAKDLYDKGDEEDMRLELFDNGAGATQRYTLTEGRIKIRGASSQYYPKKSYKLKLKTNSVGENRRANNTSLLGMRQDDDWILYSGYNDQEKVRNVFSTNLWKEGQAKNNEFKIDNGVEYKYVELILNDSYSGLYALGYPLDELQLGLKMGERGYEEFSFKKALWDGNVEDALESYELKTEVEEVSAAWEELREYYYGIKYGTSGEEIRELVDEKNMIDIRLFLELIQGSDNVGIGDDMRNMYVTAKSYKEGYKWVSTPWDLDLTFGNMWDELAVNWTAQYALSKEYNLEILSDAVAKLEALSDEKVREELKERYRELRAGAWSEENLMREIDECEREIYRSGAFSRDKEAWPEGNYNEASEGLAKFREHVRGRLGAMDKEYL